LALWLTFTGRPGARTPAETPQENGKPRPNADSEPVQRKHTARLTAS